MTGLVCTAGGARGAYQAGVLKRMSELPAFRKGSSPFKILAGASAGAINSAALSCGADDFYAAAQDLAQVWESLKFQEVFRTDAIAMGSIASSWVKDLSFGGIIGGGKAQSLLDATPLRSFLNRHLRLERVQDCIDQGDLYAVGISATNYYSGKSVCFIHGQKGHPLWTKSRRLSYSTPLKLEHVLASAAIPVVFAPVKIESDFGDYYYGDGALRLTNPCSPAIRLGAKKLLAIGIRCQRAAEETTQQSLLEASTPGQKPRMKRPALAQVLGVSLNSIFLDHLDADLDHLNRMNDLLRQGHMAAAADGRGDTMKELEAKVITPSIDLGKLSESYAHRLPSIIRYMMEGLGNSRAESADLMSYLLFDSAYTRALIDIGYRDASERADELEDFLVQKESSARRSRSS